MLQLYDIGRRFGGIQALSDVSFVITAGEAVGLIGPNGSGKSTLIGVISGAIRPSKGRISFRGIDITGMRTPTIVRLGIARNFQVPRLYWDLSVARNIAIAQLEFPKRAEAMHCFIKQYLPDLPARSASPARTLSLFEQRKLEIAMRLASGPALLLLDEPAAGLSPGEQDELVEILLALQRLPCTLIIIEHAMSVIFRACRRVLVLRGGSLIADGAPADIARDDIVIEAYLGPGAIEALR